jgi:hypothetical protein
VTDIAALDSKKKIEIRFGQLIEENKKESHAKVEFKNELKSLTHLPDSFPIPDSNAAGTAEIEIEK